MAADGAPLGKPAPLSRRAEEEVRGKEHVEKEKKHVSRERKRTVNCIVELRQSGLGVV